MDHHSRPDPSSLQFVPALRGLSDRELENLARRVDAVVAEAGEVVMSEGEASVSAFVIEQGTARITVGGAHICDLGPGEMIGEMAMLDRRPRTATVTAITALRLLPVAPSDFYSFGGLPPVAMAALKTLNDRLRAADGRLAEGAPVARPAAT